MAGPGYIGGAQMTIGTANDLIRLALDGFSTNSALASVASRTGTSQSDPVVSASIAGIRRGMFNALVIFPVAVGSSDGTFSLLVWLSKASIVGSPGENESGAMRMLVADITVQLGASPVPPALVPSGVSAVFCDTITEASSSTPITSGGVRVVSPGSELPGCIVVDLAGCDAEIEFAADGANVTSMNALVWRI